jgi:hypothetical protein
MKRSYDSFNSLTSIATSLASRSSINSRTKLYSNRDFQKYIATMEEDILRNSNHCYTIDKKINNIVNRYENRTNMLFIDLRHRETEHKRLYNKVAKAAKAANTAYSTTVQITNSDLKDIDKTYRYTMYALYVYTLFTIGMIVYSGFPCIKVSPSLIYIFSIQ